MDTSTTRKEYWATKIGLILAMAGNAVGLGNFLRFPGKAAVYGGGAYLIPYFIAFFLLGIPLFWLEWSIGRYGGQHDAHWLAPMLYLISRKKLGRRGALIAAAIGGGLTLSIGLMIEAYYTNILGWIAYWAAWCLSGKITAITTTQQAVKTFVQVLANPLYNLIPWIFTLVIVALIVAPGISRGIERAAKIMMPLLFLFAVVLMIVGFVWRTPVKPQWDTLKGFLWMWTPHMEKLADPATWLEGTGQIFFTLSLGIAGIIPTYASYMRRDEDLALSALTTATLNEICEVILGGSIAFMLAYGFGGPEPIVMVAVKGKSPFVLSMISYPAFFGKLGITGAILGSMWYLLLWFAGVTSAVALVAAVVALLEDLGVNRWIGSLMTVIILVFLGLPIVIEGWLTGGEEWGPTTVYLDFTDFIVGSLMLVVTCLVESILGGWFVWGREGLEEANRGSFIRIPEWIWKYIVSIVDPIFLVAMLIWLPMSTRIERIIHQTKAPLEWLGPTLASVSLSLFAILFIIGAIIGYRSVSKKYPE